MPGIVWHGEVARIAASADEETRTFPIYVDVDNARQSQPLIPGTFVRAEVEGPVHHDRILVPRVAVREGCVFVAEAGVVHQRAVTIERLIGERALVEGELRSGDRVILSHLGRLASGTPVRIRGGTTVSSGSGHATSPMSAGQTP
jgi:multidrug efflux pump subunit AcrA (membrane-fusion protein)